MSETAWRKLHPAIQREVDAHAADPRWATPVLVVLRGGRREGTPQEREEELAAASSGLESDLERGGARQVKRYWINWSVGATAGWEALRLAAERDEVQEIVPDSRQKAIC
jgi:hypothetical protein